MSNPADLLRRIHALERIASAPPVRGDACEAETRATAAKLATKLRAQLEAAPAAPKETP